ncbi:hypothetical protein FRX31_013313 [Thalictrum thalictroides]|uniref:Uncharacterized protein n=1 Tax=Thalictrum thalictroides TaxID=46969 RepID=A0A7J6WLV7_THATH|nr:hypothetical protein FRX31_013313 [Thalictrum thalictroides]
MEPDSSHSMRSRQSAQMQLILSGSSDGNADIWQPNCYGDRSSCFIHKKAKLARKCLYFLPLLSNNWSAIFYLV